MGIRNSGAYREALRKKNLDILWHIVVLKWKYQKKNVSDNPSMDSSTKIYIDSEKLRPKIRAWELFELTLQKDAKKS